MADRKARLAALRKLKDEAAEDPTPAADADPGEGAPKLSFRNYAPLLEAAGRVMPAAIPLKEGTVTLESQAKAVEKDTKALLEKQAAATDVDISSLAPRKPGFDLARELERRSERLEKKLNYAIAENIRQRFKDSQDISDIGISADNGSIALDDDDDE
ncbi:hypothetical protein HDU83_001372 [Entophlyctis luteolus]|nr:hypothetical protein HDU83_001372 [Entophlyctis luteolus]